MEELKQSLHEARRDYQDAVIEFTEARNRFEQLKLRDIPITSDEYHAEEKKVNEAHKRFKDADDRISEILDSLKAGT